MRSSLLFIFLLLLTLIFYKLIIGFKNARCDCYMCRLFPVLFVVVVALSIMNVAIHV